LVGRQPRNLELRLHTSRLAGVRLDVRLQVGPRGGEEGRALFRRLLPRLRQLEAGALERQQGQNLRVPGGPPPVELRPGQIKIAAVAQAVQDLKLDLGRLGRRREGQVEDAGKKGNQKGEPLHKALGVETRGAKKDFVST